MLPFSSFHCVQNSLILSCFDAVSRLQLYDPLPSQSEDSVLLQQAVAKHFTFVFSLILSICVSHRFFSLLFHCVSIFRKTKHLDVRIRGIDSGSSSASARAAPENVSGIRGKHEFLSRKKKQKQRRAAKRLLEYAEKLATHAKKAIDKRKQKKKSATGGLVSRSVKKPKGLHISLTKRNS